MTDDQDYPKISRNIHPPVLLLIHILAAFLLNWLLPLTFAFPKSLVWAGYLLVLVGLGLAISAAYQFGKAHTTLDPHGSVSVLVVEGPYRLSRNPIYLGFVCVLAGLQFALGNYWGAVLSPVLMISLYQLIIRHEEAYLEEKFGKRYTGYRSRVRRWL